MQGAIRPQTRPINTRGDARRAAGAQNPRTSLFTQMNRASYEFNDEAAEQFWEMDESFSQLS